MLRPIRALIVLFLVVAAWPAHASASPAPLVITLDGPAWVAEGATPTYFGRVQSSAVWGVSAYVYAPGQRVDLTLDGAVVARVHTDWLGRWSASVSFPKAGEHVLVAVLNSGSALQETSRPLVVGVATPPGAPTSLAAMAGPAEDQVVLSWEPPQQDGGAPITGYLVERAFENATTFESVASVAADARGFSDYPPISGNFTYRVRAENVAGPGDAAQTQVHLPEPAPVDSVTVQIVGYRLCQRGGCSSVSEGGTAYVWDGPFTLVTKLQGSVARDGQPVWGARVDGTVTAWVNEPCPPDTFCIQTVDAFEDGFATRTESTGDFAAAEGPEHPGLERWECRDVSFSVRARVPDAEGTARGAGFTVCRD